jgi:tripartite-type tricarboxylate transporter receptor subunit TctC
METAMKTPRLAFLTLMTVVLAAGSPAVLAQAYPTKPIRLIVPDAPGGSPDILGRLLAQKMSDSMGQQIVVENRPGAAGLLAAEVAARAAPDGYNLFMSTTSVWAILPSVKKDLPYDATNGFMPITRIAQASNVMVINPSVAAKTVPELVALIKASPGMMR